MLTAIAIPVFTSQLEKSREATDAANIRSAYAVVMSEALANSTADNSQTVPLKQQVTGWQNAENETSLNSLKVTEDATKGIMGVAVDVANPAKGGSVTISYDADGGSNGLGKVEIKLGTSTGGSTGGGTTGG